MFFTTLYFQEYLNLSLRDTAVSLFGRFFRTHPETDTLVNNPSVIYRSTSFQVQLRKPHLCQPLPPDSPDLSRSPHSSGTICNITVGFIAPYVPAQYILSFGSFATALSLILFAIMPVGASYWGYTFFAMVSISHSIELRVIGAINFWDFGHCLIDLFSSGRRLR